MNFYLEIYKFSVEIEVLGWWFFLAFKANLIAKEESDLQTNCESIRASMHIKGRPGLYIGAFYKRHVRINSVDLESTKELDSAIVKIPKNSQIDIAGDFNVPDVNWKKKIISSRW